MGKPWSMVAGLSVVFSLAAPGADGPPAVPADFKIQVGSFSLRKEPVSTEEVLFHDGRAYVFPSDSKEVLIIEHGRGQLDLLDVGRTLQTEVSFQSLDESLVKIKATLRGEIDRLEKQGGRANVIEAKMTRDLFETGLATAHEPNSRRVRLTNSAVEVDADGEPESDRPRLALVAATLNAIAKLGAFRVPNDLPPFIELEAIAALTGERRLRPTELTYLYRLAGPPRKFRRTYRLIPSLTDREIEAIAWVNRLREAVPSVRYERYRPMK
jgi:hypothetical protein